MKKDDIKKLSLQELEKEVVKLKKELFNLKLTLAGGQVTDYSQFGKIRSNIARCLTCLNEKKA